MSFEKDTYDAIILSMGALFPLKTRIPNPYDLIANPLVLKDSWGLKVEGASQITLELCRFSTDRTFTVILLRKFSRLETKPDSFDAITGNLLNDNKDVLNMFLNNEQFGIPEKIQNIALSNVSGIQSLSNNDETFLFIESSFNITISESYS